MKIVVIGAGIGGLTLGRCLQNCKIPFTIYEKAEGLPRHNYGITLTQQTYQRLLEAVHAHDHEFRRALGVPKAYRTQVSVAESTSETRLRLPPSAYIRSSNFDLRANRSTLETLLSKPIKQHIQHSCKLKYIRGASIPGSQVEIVLENDDVVRSDLVIDCSGVHSPIRATLLPQYQPMIHPYVALNGKRYVQPAKWEEIFEPAFGDKTVLKTNVQFEHEHEGQSRSIIARLEIAINETVLDHADRLQRVSISYTYSRKAFSEDDALFVPKRSKEAATSIPPQFFEELASLRKSGKLPSAYVEAFNPSGAGHDRLLNWLLRSAHLQDCDIKALKDQGVLMIGDAAYAEPIVGSVPGGANHVIGQAMRLADRLEIEWRSGKKVSEMDLEEYLEPKPRSEEENVAAHLARLHQLEPARAAL